MTPRFLQAPPPLLVDYGIGLHPLQPLITQPLECESKTTVCATPPFFQTL
jgi:hypothetical protein